MCTYDIFTVYQAMERFTINSCVRVCDVYRDTVWWETFEGENFHECRSLRVPHQRFLHGLFGMPHTPVQDWFSTPRKFSCSLPADPRKVFSLESFLLYYGMNIAFLLASDDS